MEEFLPLDPSFCLIGFWHALIILFLRLSASYFYQQPWEALRLLLLYIDAHSVISSITDYLVECRLYFILILKLIQIFVEIALHYFTASLLSINIDLNQVTVDSRHRDDILFYSQAFCFDIAILH